MNEEIGRALNALSLKAHIKIYNKFFAFFATQETITWQLEAEHVTHRGFIIYSSGKNLLALLLDALQKIEDYEMKMERERERENE